MKKFFLLGFLMVGLTCMISCSSDDVEPNITFGSSATSVPSDMVFPTEGGTQKLTFNSNVDWTISIAANASGLQWCTVSATSGKAGDNISVDIVVDENTGEDDRSVVITIFAGSLAKNVIITQKQKNSLLVTKQKFEIDAAGGSFEVEAKANINCEVEIPAEFDWITEDKGSSRGLVSHNFKFNVAPSEEYDKREGYIIIKGANEKETVNVYQSGSSIIILTKSKYDVDSEGGSITAEIKTNCDFKVIMPDVDWIKQNTGSRGVSSHSLTFEIAKNDGYDLRTANIVIKDQNSDKSETITIDQLQKDAMFVESDEYTAEASGGRVMIQLSTNVKCTVQIPSSCDWIHFSSSTMSRGLNDESITLTVSKNQTVVERSAEIVLTDSKSISKTITIKQKPQMLILETSTLTMMAGAEKELKCQVNSAISLDQLVWTSSNTEIVTVSQSGKLTAKKKGSATVTVKTQDGKNTARCSITVKEITDYISASSLGGSIMSINGVISSGSSLNWGFYNNSEETVRLKTMQLIDGQTGYEGNKMTVDVNVAGGSNVAYSTRIGAAGIHSPVTCRFVYEYNGKDYSIDAVFRN